MNKYLQGFVAVVAASMLATAASANMLVNPSFEDPGFVGAELPGAGDGWSTFGDNFRVQCAPPGSACADPIGGPGAFDGTVALKNFGTAGVFQEFAAAPGDSWAGSVYAMNPNNADVLVNGQVALAIISWRDSGDNEISAATSNVLTEAFATGVWNLLEVDGIAPAGTEAVQFLLLTEGGNGAPRWDAASFAPTVIPVPGALLLMGPAVLGLFGLGRRKAA